VQTVITQQQINCLISLKFDVEFDRVTADTLQLFKVKWSKDQGHILNSHQSPKYPYLRGHMGRRIQTTLL